MTSTSVTNARALMDPNTAPPSSRSGLRPLCRLGQGGMAEVHLAARSTVPGVSELCVIKRIYPHQVDDAASVRMFLDEARLALSLVHPNIVRTERLGTFGGRHGMVMEFLEGQPFHQVLKRAYERDGSFNLEVTAQIAIAALDGLHYAHELKDTSGEALSIVHRDVSPQNLLITYEGAVKLLDFGIAKNALQNGKTRTGLLKGKVSYMAPEQARGDDIDRRADLWSLGVVLWEAVTGSRLFKGANEAATLNLTLTEDVPPPSVRRSDLPPDLERILMRALERDPTKRYTTAAEMRDDLEQWLTGRELGPESSVRGLMQRLFQTELVAQREQIRGLLHSSADTVPESGMTRLTPMLAASGTFSGLRETQLSSVTDLMQELTRQRRVTTRLLGALVAIVTVALGAGFLFLLSARSLPPAEASFAAAALTVAAPAEQARAVPPPPAEARVLAPSPTPAPARAPTAPAAARSTPIGAGAAGVHHTGALATPEGSTRRRSAAADTSESGSAGVTALEPSGSGTLNLDTTPWSVVSLGGRVLGTTPIVGASLPAGTHSLVLSNPELGLKTTYQVTITPGRTTARRIGLD